MRLLTPVLLLSVAANLALGGALLWHMNQPDASTASSSSQPQTATLPAQPKEGPLVSAPWSTGEAATVSLPDLAAQLRSEGCPPAIIRALISARIQARYAERLRALRPKARDAYWRRQLFDRDGDLSPEARVARRALQREMNEEIKQALGADYESLNPYERAEQTREFGQLPSEKVAQIKAINSDYSELAAQINDRAQGVTLKEDRTQLRLLDAEKRADLAAVLSPTELLEYDLRNSPSTAILRNKLSAFDATEEEYRALASIQLEFDRQYGLSHLSNEEQERRKAAEKDLPARLQSALTPARSAELQFVTDPNYRPTENFVRSFNYDAALTRKIVGLQRTFSQRAAAIAQQPAALNALYTEASAQLATMLSGKALAAYEKRDAGQWLAKLKPQPGQPAPAPTP